jgi:hypothetical protein
MKSAPSFFLFLGFLTLSVGLFASWLFINLSFGESLLNGLWMPIAGILIGGLSLGFFRNYRLIRKVNKSKE